MSTLERLRGQFEPDAAIGTSDEIGLHFQGSSG
jgi:hypothetical protein